MYYLKKKKMYEVAKYFHGDDMPKMIDCRYRFHGGWEWLDFTLNDNTIVEFYSFKKYNGFRYRFYNEIEDTYEDSVNERFGVEYVFQR